MNEVKVFGALLSALGVLAYLSWHRDESAVDSTKVTLSSLDREGLTGVEFQTSTQTVAISLRDRGGGKKMVWFELEKGDLVRGFVGNKMAEQFVDRFAPFQAIRSLGKDLEAAELTATGLDGEPAKLKIQHRAGEKRFDVGGRTHGTKDFYVRAESGTEVYLVESKTLGDLEYPETQMMQRKLREAPLSEVEKIALSSALGSLSLIHKNRLSPEDEYWVSEENPEEKNDTYANFVDKLSKLTAVDYLTDDKGLEGTTVVLELSWVDEKGKPQGTMKLWKKGEGKEADYFASSDFVGATAKLARFSGEQLERDMPLVFGSK